MQRRTLKSVLSRAVIRIIPRKFLSQSRRFRRDGHNQILFRSMQLSNRSVVLDFGGYIGEFTNEVHERFNCEIHVFEPVPTFFEALSSRFLEVPQVHLHNFAVGVGSGTLTLFLEGEATREVGEGESVECLMLSPEDACLTNLAQIDLIAMNIEGGEYELIPALDAADLLARSDQILVQFHRVDANYSAKFDVCTQILSKTHTREWQYEYVWESWRRKATT